MKKPQWVIISILIILAVSAVNSETVNVSTLDEKTMLNGHWLTHPGEFRESDSWSEVIFPSAGYQYPEEESHTYYFKRSFIIEKKLQGKGIALVLGHLPDPARIYINDSLVLNVGIYPPAGYYADCFKAQSLIVPDGIINFDAPNELMIKLYTQKPSGSLPSAYFCDEKTRAAAISRSQILNQYMGAIAASMAFLTSLYFLVLFLLNKKEKTNFFLFIGALGFSINVSSLFIISRTLPYLLMFKIQNIGLYWGISCVILFIQHYMERHQNPRIRRFFLIAAASMSVAILAMPDFKSTLFLNDTIFYILYIGPVLVYMLYLGIRGHHDGIYFSTVLLIGIIMALGGGLRDISLIIIGHTPEFYTNTIGMVCLVVCLFISYAARFNMNRKLSEIAKYELEIKNKNIALMNSSLERFIPNEVLSYLQKESIIEIDLGDHAEEMMTVMFTDIRDFTHLSEAMNPEENFKFINSYLNRMGPVIRKNNGFVDKYLGDGIMALFPRRPEDAVNAALEMRNELERYNGHRANCGYNSIRIGIGIHYGMLMIGTIGEEMRMDSTVISDTVNIAARLESLTKELQTDILISEEMKKQIDQLDLSMNFLGHQEVKGKKVPLAVYSLH